LPIGVYVDEFDSISSPFSLWFITILLEHGHDIGFLLEDFNGFFFESSFHLYIPLAYISRLNVISAFASDENLFASDQRVGKISCHQDYLSAKLNSL
jgi:hypothetical protein